MEKVSNNLDNTSIYINLNFLRNSYDLLHFEEDFMVIFSNEVNKYELNYEKKLFLVERMEEISTKPLIFSEYI